jgi:hypothetical protein
MPRCKNCKEKFEAKHFNQKYCFKSECVKVWVETAKVKNWKKEKKRLKDELETVQSLTKKAQRYFNAYIRERDNVHGQCVACNQHKHGNLLNYQIGIEKRIGGEELIKLHEEAHKVRKYTRQELKDIIEKYKQKKKDLNK